MLLLLLRRQGQGLNAGELRAVTISWGDSRGSQEWRGWQRDCLGWALGVGSMVVPLPGRNLEQKQVCGRWKPLWVLWALLQAVQ